LGDEQGGRPRLARLDSTAACTVLCTTTKTNPILIVGGAAFVGWLGWVLRRDRFREIPPFRQAIL
jgi:hypothetical protein